MSSPRTRGCFLDLLQAVQLECVFPAHAGVFPDFCRTAPVPSCLPRARGGVPQVHSAPDAACMSSQRTRGCFLLGVDGMGLADVFPAHAGVLVCRFSGTRSCRVQLILGVTRQLRCG